MKRGFTLVELLAVILIISLLGLIASSTVGKILNDSKEQLTDVEINAIKDAAKVWGVENNKKMPESGECIYLTLEDLKEEGFLDEDIINPKNGKKFKNKMNIKITSKTNRMNKIVFEYVVDTNDVEGCINPNEPLCTANTTPATAFVYNDGDPIYKESYTPNSYVGLLASEEGEYKSGVAYTCNFGKTEDTKNLTFFVLSEELDSVTFIAGFNLKSSSKNVHTVAWSADGNNHKDETEDKQALTAKKALLERTVNWSSKNGGKLNNAQMATIKLPTANQIAKAIGKTFSHSGTEGLPTWLTSYSKEPVAYGYWTSTPDNEYTDQVWSVLSYYEGIVTGYSDGILNDYCFGVRPVITLPKNRLG